MQKNPWGNTPQTPIYIFEKNPDYNNLVADSARSTQNKKGMQFNYYLKPPVHLYNVFFPAATQLNANYFPLDGKRERKLSYKGRSTYFEQRGVELQGRTPGRDLEQAGCASLLSRLPALVLSLPADKNNGLWKKQNPKSNPNRVSEASESPPEMQDLANRRGWRGQGKPCF